MQVDQQGEQQQPQGLQDKQQQQQPEAEPMPDRLKDYSGWLAWQKQRWRAGRQERKRRKVEAGRRPQAASEQEVPQVGGSWHGAVTLAHAGGCGLSRAVGGYIIWLTCKLMFLALLPHPQSSVLPFCGRQQTNQH